MTTSNTAWAREAAYKITRAYSRTLGAEAEPMIAQDIADTLLAVERQAKEAAADICDAEADRCMVESHKAMTEKRADWYATKCVAAAKLAAAIRSHLEEGDNQ